MNRKKYKKYIEQLYNNNETKQDEAFKNYVLDIVLAKFVHGEAVDSELSRHAIMHGADKDYGTFDNSIKAILLFDYLQDRFNYFHIEDSKVFHRFGCRYLSNTNKKIIGSKSLKNLYSHGFEPCKLCMRDIDAIDKLLIQHQLTQQFPTHPSDTDIAQ